MKKILVIAILIISSCAFAQDQNMIKAGAKSLNFTFGGLGTFAIGASGVSGGIGGSYFLSNTAAVRLGLQIRSTNSTTPWNDLSGNGTNPGVDGSTSTFAVGVAADYLMYMSSMSERVKPYFGGGVYVTMNSSDTKYSIANSAGNGTPTEVKNGNFSDGLTFGLAGIAGAEFFLYPEVSLSAEYQLNLFSMTSRSDRVSSFKGVSDVTTKQGGTTNILGFSGGGATLHIYF